MGIAYEHFGRLICNLFGFLISFTLANTLNVLDTLLISLSCQSVCHM